MFLTVFTPTYNRSILLKKLYQSLIVQQEYDFEWLIVDDGSSDDTREVVRKFQQDNFFEIRYIYQENAGKHVAFNRAIKEAKGDYFLCVDSDDRLGFDAVRELKKEAQSMVCGAAGIISLKSLEDGTIIGGEFPINVKYSSLYNLSSVYHCGADRTLVYRSRILEQYCFPVIENEKFMTECVLYDQIDMKYEMKLANIVTTVCEYQEDGLSSNLRKIQINNPVGTALFYRQRLELTKCLKEKWAYKVRCDAFEYLSFKSGQGVQLNAVSRLIGWIVSKYYHFRAK